MTITPETFCRLKDGTLMQKTPKGATLHISGLRDGGASPWRKTAKRAVNRDGAMVLELCDGARTAEKLAADFSALHPDNKLSAMDAVSFLQAAERTGMIDARETPAKLSGVRVCGSFDHFYPEHTTVELTNNCDLFCRHCYRSSSAQAELFIDRGPLLRYLEDFYAHGGAIVELTGGEATLHPDFFTIAEWCHGHMKTVGLLTNAYGLGAKEAERLAPFRDNMVVAVSLDSHRPGFHNGFRGRPDAFERTTAAIKLLAERGFLVRVGMSVTLDNFFDIEETLKLAKTLGAARFSYSMVYDVGRAGDSVLSQVRKLPDSARYLEYYNRVARENGDFLVTISKQQQESLKKGNCGLVHRTVTLGPDGALRPCVMFKESIELGNIGRQSFAQIFDGPLGARFAALPGPKPELCGGCPDLHYCANCVLRGLKTAAEKGGCAWLEKAGAADLAGRMNLKGKACATAAEPDLGTQP